MAVSKHNYNENFFGDFKVWENHAPCFLCTETFCHVTDMTDIWCDKVFDSSWKQADTWTEGQNNHLFLPLELVQAFYYVMD